MQLQIVSDQAKHKANVTERKSKHHKTGYWMAWNSQHQFDNCFSIYRRRANQKVPLMHQMCYVYQKYVWLDVLQFERHAIKFGFQIGMKMRYFFGFLFATIHATKKSCDHDVFDVLVAFNFIDSKWTMIEFCVYCIPFSYRWIIIDRMRNSVRATIINQMEQGDWYLKNTIIHFDVIDLSLVSIFRIKIIMAMTILSYKGKRCTKFRGSFLFSFDVAAFFAWYFGQHLGN